MRAIRSTRQEKSNKQHPVGEPERQDIKLEELHALAEAAAASFKDFLLAFARLVDVRERGSSSPGEKVIRTG